MRIGNTSDSLPMQHIDTAQKIVGELPRMVAVASDEIKAIAYDLLEEFVEGPCVSAKSRELPRAMRDCLPVKIGMPFLPGRLPIFRVGGKTVGVLSTASGDISLTSGLEGPAKSMPSGMAGFNIVTRTHVEGHAAAAMHQGGIREATLYINNPTVCISCTKLLPRMLPADSTLTVVTPTGSTTFVGISR